MEINPSQRGWKNRWRSMSDAPSSTPPTPPIQLVAAFAFNLALLRTLTFSRRKNFLFHISPKRTTPCFCIPFTSPALTLEKGSVFCDFGCGSTTSTADSKSRSRNRLHCTSMLQTPTISSTTALPSAKDGSSAGFPAVGFRRSSSTGLIANIAVMISRAFCVAPNACALAFRASSTAAATSSSVPPAVEAFSAANSAASVALTDITFLVTVRSIRAMNASSRDSIRRATGYAPYKQKIANAVGFAARRLYSVRGEGSEMSERMISQRTSRLRSMDVVP
ncbi:hypothetical protein FN846DRAFT_973406 [Sphaerosporella brunnea]|uniref:Uncharacterized protein n=1 Tax=Sphaerosporella brunnea TaxID=1250544 RepID=A0A5J5EFV7_9PEZI|nr:hypothetical protein FN846DRAFT_973406 [Sphaerosporella brunnea]